MAKNGEVKVWQPIFIDMKGVASKKELLFNVCGLKWRLAGTFSCRVPANVTVPCMMTSKGGTRGSSDPAMRDRVGGQAVGAFLDPTCMTLGVCFNDGRYASADFYMAVFLFPCCAVTRSMPHYNSMM